MAEALKTIGEGCLEFNGQGTGINLVPFEKVAFVPRVGDIVHLPGQGSARNYRVTAVVHYYSQDEKSDMPKNLGPAKLSRVTISVEPEGMP
jgi:hypothetical protein